MAQVARLVGMEVREYKGSDGQQRQFCGLHLVYLPDSVRDVKGSKAENVSCPRNIDPHTLQIGKLYQLEYEIYETKNGKGARLAEMLPIDESKAK